MVPTDCLEQFSPPPDGVVLTIGNFDGVHVGHHALIEQARLAAPTHATQIVAMTFEPHPLSVLRPEQPVARLTTALEKRALFERAGVDALLVVRSEKSFFAKLPDEFFNDYVMPCKPRAIVEGPTFRFGRGRAGSVETLRSLGAEHGIQVYVLDEVRCGAVDGVPAVNSSAIRAALRDGRIEDANAMLGRPHRVVGRVVSGDSRGRTIGFPTANLSDVPQLPPNDGVYAAVAQLESDDLFAAAVNVGPQPTFEQDGRRIEAHLLDFDRALNGEMLGLHFVRRLRGQQKFDSAAALAAQLRRDVEHARGAIDLSRLTKSLAVIPL